MATSPFSAADAMLGYLYQVRCALLWALRRLKSEDDFLVALEALDDVTFESKGGDPRELLQTKHHHRGSASLTDASPDLWKTLRIWVEGFASGRIPDRVRLCLITTAKAPDGSAASYLRPEKRDVDVALKRLDAVARSSDNQANVRAYSAYRSLNRETRRALLERIVVLDAFPTIENVDEELRREVYWAAERRYHEAFLDRLEGWWLRRVLRQLVESETDRIAAGEIEAKMADLREQFREDSLPIDDDLLEFALDDVTWEAYSESMFVRQLDLIQAGKRRIAAAIRDYYRAFEQRSRWLREDLLVEMDLAKYEHRLIEEWELVFEAMRDELGDAATEAAKMKAAREVLAWAERTTIPIRPKVTEPFVSRGSFHILADDLRIGWHPEFRERLATVLLRGEGSAR